MLSSPGFAATFQLGHAAALLPRCILGALNGNAWPAKSSSLIAGLRHLAATLGATLGSIPYLQGG